MGEGNDGKESIDGSEAEMMEMGSVEEADRTGVAV